MVVGRSILQFQLGSLLGGQFEKHIKYVEVSLVNPWLCNSALLQHEFCQSCTFYATILIQKHFCVLAKARRIVVMHCASISKC